MDQETGQAALIARLSNTFRRYHSCLDRKTLVGKAVLVMSNISTVVLLVALTVRYLCLA